MWSSGRNIFGYRVTSQPRCFTRQIIRCIIRPIIWPYDASQVRCDILANKKSKSRWPDLFQFVIWRFVDNWQVLSFDENYRIDSHRESHNIQIWKSISFIAAVSVKFDSCELRWKKAPDWQYSLIGLKATYSYVKIVVGGGVKHWKWRTKENFVLVTPVLGIGQTSSLL